MPPTWSWPVATPLVLLCAWEWASTTGAIREAFFQRPSTIAVHLERLAADGTLWGHLAATLIRVVWAFTLAAVLGVGTSTFASTSNPSVLKKGAIRQLDNINGPTGASGDIVVRFLAAKKGTAKVTWKIVRTPTDSSLVTSLVQVQ